MTTSIDVAASIAKSPLWALGTDSPTGSEDATTLVQPGNGESLTLPLDDFAAASLDNPRAKIVLGLRPNECFAIWIEDAAGRIGKHSIETLRFELENSLPLDAEEITADAIRHPEGFLALVVDTARLLPALDAIEATGTWVISATPLIFLAVQQLEPEMRQPDHSDHLVVWQEGEHVHLIHLRQGQPRRWEWLPAEPEYVRDRLDAVSAGLNGSEGRNEGEQSGPTNERLPLMPLNEVVEPEAASGNDRQKPENVIPVWMLSVSEPVERQLRGATGIDRVDLGEREISELAEIAARQITAGILAPWCDLRTDALAPAQRDRLIRGPLAGLKLAVTACLFAWILVSFYRGWQYSQQVDASTAHQRAVFQELFPDEPVPVGIGSRLRSEQRRLAGTRGASGGDIPQLKAVVPALHAFLAALPREQRYRFDRLEFDAEGLRTSRGVARSYDDAEAVRSALAKAGFQVRPLSAAQTAKGVTLQFDNAALVEKTEIRNRQPSRARGEAP